MTQQEEFEFSSVRLVPEFSSYCTEENIVWVPDAITLKLRRKSDSVNGMEVSHSHTSLEHIFLLLNQLEEGEPGTVLWGSSSIGVTFTGDRVALSHKGSKLVGSPTSARQAVENLVRETFEELHRQGVDTHHVARQLQQGRFAPWTADPLEIHNQMRD
ncbi:hypothetical protein [Natrinema salaciae]|uniref:Uncharacterized protein n=1 Tax=Natrinema salaciae TaxID=1186196 RepID=A0A1H8ZQQ8_9EURY|nr:hypothetical protein [Natrinema salaciae]SEP66839.1 hypothetical protein SAMN04489841_0239 [Natrinema salaciae]